VQTSREAQEMAGNPAMMVDPWGLDGGSSEFIGPPAPTMGQTVDLGDGIVKIFNGSSWLKGVQVTADRSTNWNGSWNIFGLIPKFDYSNSASSTDWSNTFKAVGNAAINLVNSVPELANLGLYNAEMIHKHGISEYSSKLKELTVTEIASSYSYIAETPLQEIGDDVVSGLHTPQFAEGLYTLSFSVILARPSTSGAALARPKSVSTPVVAADASASIDPFSVRFSQASVSSKFRTGGSIDELADALRRGTVMPNEVPPIRLVNRDGVLYTLDNRRLEAFRRAEVNVPYRMATDAEVAGESWKFTTSNGGETIRVRGK